MSFSLKQIRYFIAVAETGSISGAAHQVSISQSTITESIKSLEGFVGTKLLHRKGKGVELTLDGHKFLRHAYNIISSVASAEHSVSTHVRSMSGQLNIGVTSLVAGYYLADLLAQFRRSYPDITTHVIEDSRSYIEHLLVNGELDVGIILTSNLENQFALHSETLLKSNYRLWLPAGHDLLARDIVNLTLLENQQFVVLNIDELDERIEDYWRREKIRPAIALRTGSVEAVRSLVATGAGLAILPDLTYRPWSLEGDRVEARDLPHTMPTLEIGMVWRHGSKLSEVAQEFIEVANRYKISRAKHH